LSSLLETAGIDTHLARALLEAGRLDYPTLAASLEGARRGRGVGPTLARALCQGGLMSEEELEATISRVLGRPPASWAPGAQVAGVEILRLLGAGGMGAVYLARDLQTGAEVAIKTLALGEDPELLARFEREAEAQARVGGHPNVISVHRFGVTAGRAFLVMDVASGGDLAERLQGGVLDPHEAARLVRALCEGLEHAHARGVLHRDLKPANVLFDEGGAPRLTDFGLARLVGAESLTQTGEVLGTPAYMAPEQALAGEVDSRTDVYGLGAILFAALTGRAPFAGGTLIALLARVAEGLPPSVRELNPEVPEGLARIVSRCLNKDPGKRYATVRSLAEALESFLLGRGESRVSGVLLGVAALVLVAVLVVTAALWARLSEASPAQTPSASAGPSAGAELDSPLELKELRAVLGQLPPGERAQRVDRAVARSQHVPSWLAEAARAEFASILFEGVRGARDLGDGNLLAWSGDETRLYDARTQELRQTWNKPFLALSPSGQRVLLGGGKSLEAVDVRTGAILMRRARASSPVKWAGFQGEGQFLLASREQFGASVEAHELFQQEIMKAGGSAIVEGLQRFVIRGEKVFYTWATSKASGGGIGYFAWNSSARGQGPDSLSKGADWRITSVGDGHPSCLASSPGGLLAMGTSSGRIHLFPPGREPEPKKLTNEASGPGAQKAQLSAVKGLHWVGEATLLAVEEDQGIWVWRDRGSAWVREQEIPIEGLKACSLSPDRRRILVVRPGSVSLHLLSGYLQDQAREGPLYPTSAVAQRVIAWGRAQAERPRAQGAGSEHRQRAWACFEFARGLPLNAAQRAEVDKWRKRLRPRPGATLIEGPDRESVIGTEVGPQDKSLVGCVAGLAEAPGKPSNHLRTARALARVGDLESAWRFFAQAEALTLTLELQRDRVGLRNHAKDIREAIEEQALIQKAAVSGSSAPGER
jgi:protein kinase-like protein